MGFYDDEKLLHRKEHHCQREEICRVGKMSATCQMTPKTHTWSPRKLNSKRINSSSQEVGSDLKGSGKRKRH